jgi:hypothetical protein
MGGFAAAPIPSPGEKVDFSLPAIRAMKKTEVECGQKCWLR